MSEQQNNMKDLMNFLISEFVIQSETQVREKNPKHTYGKILKLSLIVYPSLKVKQRLTWTNYTGDSWLNEKEKEEIAKLFQIDLATEMTDKNRFGKVLKSLMCKIDVKLQKIFVQYDFADGSEPFKLEI